MAEVAPDTAQPITTDQTEPTQTEPTQTEPTEPDVEFAIDDMAFGESGVLWATTGDERSVRSGVPLGTPRYLYRLVGNVWQLVDQPKTVFDVPIRWEILAAPGGGVYLGSSPISTDTGPSGTGGVYFTDGTNWELYEQEYACGSLAVDTTGSLWATCPDFLVQLVDGRWVDIPEGWAAQSVAGGPDGSVWFTTFSASYELLRFDGSRWSTVAPCYDCDGPRSILGIDAAGGAWVARGACGVDGITRFDPSGDKTEIDIRGASDIAFDADGAAWIALPCAELSLPAGVARYTNGDVRLYTTADGLPSNDVQTVETGPDGTIYAGSDFGVSRYDPEADNWIPVGNR